MTSASNQADRVASRAGPRRPPPITCMAVTATFVGLALLAVGCGGSNHPSVAGSASSTTNNASDSTSALSGVAYAQCMRNHGIHDFPDPTPGAGIAFQINAGPGSDLSANDPRFQAADQACRSLLPGGGKQARPASAQKITEEVKWAACMRAHGLPSFPDPNAQGAFDSSKMDDASPLFQKASQACTSLQPTGSMTAVAGHGQ
jgi:hypothetical protein